MQGSVDEVDADHSLVDCVDRVDDEDDPEDENEQGDATADHTFDL